MLMTREAGDRKQNTGRGRVRHTPRQSNTVNTYIGFTQTQHPPLKLRNAPWPLQADHRRSSLHRQATCGCSPWRRWDCQQLHSRHQAFSSSQSPTITTFLVSVTGTDECNNLCWQRTYTPLDAGTWLPVPTVMVPKRQQNYLVFTDPRCLWSFLEMRERVCIAFQQPPTLLIICIALYTLCNRK